ncbi:hypothetical protein ASPZODRAFT_131794 [Penicilliopsis zonata CBS 506.65]|uniref:tRNA N(3)-methylcytidine methyltransferase n=1 Tax=Penicilliopsis zonata CBS 506.65 TaxID=1073090 RepID=A0A1L9SIF9_9EURO|nr:hypothetical protein ASPZODRAFT_131794 [Penicilliopsis zonata CBS 506.65]OJJ46891.1 hypothetical protein ASPZODRAFT_131794 [Penicilliopsis zonata CBS 506.65]
MASTDLPSAAPDSDIIAVLQRSEPLTVPPTRPNDPTNNLKRVDPFQFGSRYLEQGDDVFEYNAWDHVEPDDEYLAFAEVQYARQREFPVNDFDRQRFNNDPAKWWNLFYKNNTANFFKNRKWLQQEFPVLAEVTNRGAGPKVVLEVGAGAGNTAFPLLANNENPELRLHACDFSKEAVKVMRASKHYGSEIMTADVWDVAAEGDDWMPPGLTEGTVDVVVLIFIFSALAPNQWNTALRNIYRLLKPGGKILFRDYGRGDLAQVRFKKNRLMADNFYVRGDGTRVYFFDKEELVYMFNKWTLEKGIEIGGGGSSEASTPAPDEGTPEGSSGGPSDAAGQTQDANGAFEIVDLGIDRRLIVNRQRRIKMYRCWMQGHFRKRIDAEAES